MKPEDKTEAIYREYLERVREIERGEPEAEERSSLGMRIGMFVVFLLVIALVKALFIAARG